jgi:hypothetical protein
MAGDFALTVPARRSGDKTSKSKSSRFPLDWPPSDVNSPARKAAMGKRALFPLILILLGQPLVAEVPLANAQPSGTVAISVNRTGTVNRQGTATIGGTLSCSEPAVVDQFFGNLVQKHRQAVIDDAYNLNSGFPCSGKTPWSATLSGPYHPGKARFTLEATLVTESGAALSPADFTDSGRIILRPAQ